MEFVGNRRDWLKLVGIVNDHPSLDIFCCSHSRTPNNTRSNYPNTHLNIHGRHPSLIRTNRFHAKNT